LSSEERDLSVPSKDYLKSEKFEGHLESVEPVKELDVLPLKDSVDVYRLGESDVATHGSKKKRNIFRPSDRREKAAVDHGHAGDLVDFDGAVDVVERTEELETLPILGYANVYYHPDKKRKVFIGRLRLPFPNQKGYYSVERALDSYTGSSSLHGKNMAGLLTDSRRGSLENIIRKNETSISSDAERARAGEGDDSGVCSDNTTGPSVDKRPPHSRVTYLSLEPVGDSTSSHALASSNQSSMSASDRVGGSSSLLAFLRRQLTQVSPGRVALAVSP
jgi:hypothetical protein